MVVDCRDGHSLVLSGIRCGKKWRKRRVVVQLGDVADGEFCVL